MKGYIFTFLLFFSASMNLYAGHSITYSDKTYPCFSSDGTFNLYNNVRRWSREDFLIGGNEAREGKNCYGAGAIPPWAPRIAYEGLDAIFYPVCRESYAQRIDPYKHGIIYYQEEICPEGTLENSVFRGFSLDEDSFFVGLNAEYHRLHVPYRATSRLSQLGFSNRCDLFHPKTRLAGSVYLLKQLSLNQNLFGGLHEDWKPYTYNLVNESGGVERECDGGYSAVATHYVHQITLWENFFYSNHVAHNASTLSHEGQHEIESHIWCDRSDRGFQCDTGYEMYNESLFDLGDDDTNAYTISTWVQEDLIKSFKVLNNSTKQVIRFYDRGRPNPGYKCIMRPLLEGSLGFYAFNFVSSDNKGFNIPKPTYEYATYPEMMSDLNPSWRCDEYLCDPADYVYLPGFDTNLSCNETLNRDNIEVNAHNRMVCDPNRDIAIDYRERIMNGSQENHQSIYNNYYNTIMREKRACAPITQAHVSNYCDERIADVNDVAILDEYGYMEKYSRSGADFCVRRFCEQDDVVEKIWGEYSGEYLYNWWTGLDRSDEELLERIQNTSGVGRSCLDYYCGDDLTCILRYIRFEGNTELVNEDLNECTETYLSCIEETGEDFRLEDYPEYIISEEAEKPNLGGLTSSISDEPEEGHLSSFDRLNHFACLEAYRMCEVREVAIKGKILASLYKERADSLPFLTRARGEEKINPSDFISPRLRKSSKQYFTDELLHHLEGLNKDPYNFENLKKFNYWYSMPENKSSFAHFMPEGFLSMYGEEYSEYIAGPWIKSFSPLSRKDLSKVSPEVSSLLKERDKLSKLLAHYSGKNIRFILLNASKKLPKKKYLFLLRKLKKAKNLSQKIKALKALTIKKK